jgi:hypothetical protein
VHVVGLSLGPARRKIIYGVCDPGLTNITYWVCNPSLISGNGSAGARREQN